MIISVMKTIVIMWLWWEVVTYNNDVAERLEDQIAWITLTLRLGGLLAMIYWLGWNT